MRILHTSDWHLGQHFMGKSRQAEHQQLIDWLVLQVNEHAVDAVLIAGDIFDTGSPPSYARELYSQLVVRLHGAGVALLLLGGNHDSVSTLGESRALLACLSTTVVGAANDPQAQVVVLPRRGGLNEPGCVVCAIPFIRPRDVLQSQAGQSAQDKEQSLQAAIQAHYTARVGCASLQRTALEAQLGHSCRLSPPATSPPWAPAPASRCARFMWARLEAFPTSAFPPVDYIALGHIHQPQKVGGLDHIRYCGSPIPLSFDEAKQQRSAAGGSGCARPATRSPRCPCPAFSTLASLSGKLGYAGRCTSDRRRAKARPTTPCGWK